MDILVGRGGNQSMPITDETVSRIHCKIEVLDTGHIAVTNLSTSGTLLNGQKLVKRTLAKKSTSSQRASDQLTSYAIPVAKSAQACYLMDEGKYWEAQNLIYEAGDALYDMQDGSDILQGIYATMLVVCARLYMKVGRLDVGLEAINGAISIFDRLPADIPGNSAEQRGEADQIVTLINNQIARK